jgi:hypothetical protein
MYKAIERGNREGQLRTGPWERSKWTLGGTRPQEVDSEPDIQNGTVGASLN